MDPSKLIKRKRKTSNRFISCDGDLVKIRIKTFMIHFVLFFTK